MKVDLSDLIGGTIVKVEQSYYDVTIYVKKDKIYKVEFIACATEGFSKECECGGVVYIEPEEIDEHSYVEYSIEVMSSGRK